MCPLERESRRKGCFDTTASAPQTRWDTCLDVYAGLPAADGMDTSQRDMITSSISSNVLYKLIILH